MAERRRLLRLVTLGIVGAAALVAGCQEQLEGGSGCPVLCPAEPGLLRDTILEAVELDTTLVGFPTIGLNPSVLVAARGDTLETRGIFRFDLLPRTFRPNNGVTDDSVRAVDSTFLVLRLDSSAVRGRQPITVEAFDVDTAESDSVSSVVASLFRPDRLLGRRTLPADSLRDSVRIRLVDSLVAAKVRGQRRLRVGVALRSADGAQIRVGAYAGGVSTVRVDFDPLGDTTYAPLRVALQSATPEDNVDFATAYSAYTLPIRGTARPPRGEWSVGGVPGRRAYLRFRIPAAIQDSSTIVRAQLLLTQRRAPVVDATRPITLRPYVGVAAAVVTDLFRAAALASLADGILTPPVDTLRVAPADTGLRTLSVVGVVRSWALLDRTLPRVLVFGLEQEGVTGQELRFGSTAAVPSQRPRLRITYQPRREFGLP
jgi:hypothetical protein